MQNGDYYISDPRTTWSHTMSLAEFKKEIFKIQQKIKEQKYLDVYTRKEIKTAKDIGTYHYYEVVEGDVEERTLLGAYIDGVLYGDTTIVH